MDIIYQLPFPEEVCSKILYYTCKSPHNGLGVGVLKHFAYMEGSYEEKQMGLIPKQDIDLQYFQSSDYQFINTFRPLDLFKFARFTKLRKLTITSIYLNGATSSVTGDIEVIQYMPLLMDLFITEPVIYGSIGHLASLTKLEYVYIIRTAITGNITPLHSLHNLKTFTVLYTDICGDIMHFKELQNLISIYVDNTRINTDTMEAFARYRKTQRLSDCTIVTA